MTSIGIAGVEVIERELLVMALMNPE